jgi:hypothetical protein
MSIINWLLKKQTYKKSASKIIKQQATLTTVVHVEKLLKNLVEKSNDEANSVLLATFYLWLSLEVQILGIPEAKFKKWDGNYASLLRILVAKLKATLLDLSLEENEVQQYEKPVIIKILKQQSIENKSLTPLTEIGIDCHKHLIGILHKNDISLTIASELLFLNWVALSIKINGVPEKTYQQVEANLDIIIQELRLYLVQLF